MYFKLSARELEILDSQRQVILGTLLQHQSSGRPRNQKPPFLVVPFDPSGLICIIQIEEEVRKSETTLNENKERQQRCNKHLHSNRSHLKCQNCVDSEEDLFENLSNCVHVHTFPEDSLDWINLGRKYLKHLRNLLARIAGLMRIGYPPDLVDRKAKRHRRRMAEDLAMSWTGAMLSATGPLRATKDPILHDRDFQDDLDPILKLKCDVSIVSTYHQVFNVVDAILQSGLWTTELS